MKLESAPIREVRHYREGIVITESEANFLVQWRMIGQCNDCSTAAINRTIYHPVTMFDANSSNEKTRKQWAEIKEALKDENIFR